jgi:hypothetical protein
MSKYNTTTCLNIMLGRFWDDVVGADLCKVTSFVEIRFVGRCKINVYAKVLGAAVLLVRGCRDDIVSAIRMLISIPEVFLILRPVHSIDARMTEEPSRMPVRANAAGKFQEATFEIDKPFESVSLMKAFESLRVTMSVATELKTHPG